MAAVRLQLVKNVRNVALTLYTTSLCLMKRRSERHKQCAEPKIFTLPQTPLPGGAGRPKCNQLEMVTTFTYTNPVW